MFTFAEIPFGFGLVLVWAVAGLAVAALTWCVNGGRALFVQDTIVGLLGALAGGFAASHLGIDPLASIALAILGAWALVVVARTASLRWPRRT